MSLDCTTSGLFLPQDKEVKTDAAMSIFTTMIQVAQKEVGTMRLSRLGTIGGSRMDWALGEAICLVLIT